MHWSSAEHPDLDVEMDASLRPVRIATGTRERGFGTLENVSNVPFGPFDIVITVIFVLLRRQGWRLNGA